MNASNHGRRPLARLALAGGGVAAFTGLAEAAHVLAVLIGGPRGVAAGMLLAGAVFAWCGRVFRERPHQAPGPARLTEVTAEPAAGREQVKTAA